jgi:transposase
MRVAALDLADVRGVKFAAKRYNLGVSTLYRWRHDMMKGDKKCAV